MNVATRFFCKKLIALFLVFLAFSSMSVAPVTETALSDDGTQVCREEASSVALVEELFALEVSMTSTYLSYCRGELLNPAPFIPSHTNRGPPNTLVV